MSAAVITGHLAMLAFSMLVSGSFVLGVRVAGDIAPMALIALRFGLATMVFAMLVTIWRGRSGLSLSLRHLGMGALMGAYFVLMFSALARTSSVNTAAIFTMLPLFSGLLDRLINRRSLSARAWAAVLAGAFGAVLVVTRGAPAQLFGFGWASGEMLFLIGCFSHALYVALTPRASAGQPAETFTLGVLAGGAMAVALAGAGDLAATDWAALPARVWWVLAYLAIPATCATFLLMRIASLRLPAAKVAAYTYLVPVWVMLGEVVLGGPVPGGIALGVALIIGALLTLLLDRRTAPS